MKPRPMQPRSILNLREGDFLKVWGEGKKNGEQVPRERDK